MRSFFNRTIVFPLLMYAAFANLHPQFAIAQAPVTSENAPALQPTPEVVGTVNPTENIPAPNQSQRFEAFNSIPNIWASIESAAKNNELRIVHDQVRVLREKSLIAGVYNLENYAIKLIEYGEERLRLKDLDSAALYSRKALELAPDSPTAVLRGLHLSNRTHSGDTWTLLKLSLWGFLNRSDLVVYAVHVLAYPVLWALTLGAYVILILQVVAAPVRLLQGLKDRLPLPMPSIWGPIAFFALLLFPLTYGVLACLFIWALLVIFLIPGRKWLGFVSGTVLAFWGVIVPIQENHQLFLRSEGGRALLRAFSDSYLEGDEERLSAFVKSETPSGPALFALGSIMKRKGELDRAAEYFRQAAPLLPQEAAPVGELGSILFLKGDLTGAIEHYEAADKQGISSPELYFNLSKLKFEAFDTAASKFYLEKAERLDPERTKIMREREELFSDQARYALADMQLPMKYLWRVMRLPILETRERVDSVLSSLAPSVGPFGLVFAGLLLMIAGYFSANRSKTDYYRAERIKGAESKFSVLIRIIPGGSCVVGERPALGVLIAAAAIFMLFPMMEWPSGSGKLFAIFSGIYPYYVGIVVLYVLICPWIGYEED